MRKFLIVHRIEGKSQKSKCYQIMEDITLLRIGLWKIFYALHVGDNETIISYVNPIRDLFNVL